MGKYQILLLLLFSLTKTFGQNNYIGLFYTNIDTLEIKFKLYVDNELKSGIIYIKNNEPNCLNENVINISPVDLKQGTTVIKITDHRGKIKYYFILKLFGSSLTLSTKKGRVSASLVNRCVKIKME